MQSAKGILSTRGQYTDCYGHTATTAVTTATTTVTTATTTATSGYCDFIPVCYVSEYWYYSIKLRYITFPSLLCMKIQHLLYFGFLVIGRCGGLLLKRMGFGERGCQL